MKRGRNYIVAGLAAIHVVVWVDELVAALLSQEFDSSVRYHLVCIHVRGSARTSLENVPHELVIQPTVDNFLGSLGDSFSQLAWQQSKRGIGLRSMFLDQPDRSDEASGKAQ